MNTNIITGALATINDAALSKLTQKAGVIVAAITEKRNELTDVNKNIGSMQKDLVALSQDTINAVSIMGAPLSSTPNENEKTLALIFERMNKAKQDCVGAKADRLSLGIKAEREAAAGLQNQIDELVDELGKITFKPTTAGQVIGK